MSFSFNLAGKPGELIAEVGHRAANDQQIPGGFADSINDQLGRLPEDTEVTLVCYGHTGWQRGQTAGEISLHATLAFRTEPAPAVGEIEDRDPEVQPGPERFPESFEGDPPAGPAADDPA